MRMIFAVAFSLASMLCVAQAADVAKPLTVGKCIDVLSGLKAVSGGYMQQTRENGQQGASPQQYKLGRTRLPIALDIAALQPVADSVEKARQGLIAEIFGGKEAKDGSPEMSRFTAEMQKLLDAPCNVAPGHIALADLKIGDAPDNNPIPPATISALLPILDQ